MPDIDIQIVDRASDDDIEALYRAAGWWDDAPGERESLPAILTGSFCFAVAKDGDRVIGMARAICDGASDAWIQDVTVLPEYRKRGLGGALVKAVARNCRERNIGWIGLVAETGTRSFYEALGFRTMTGEPMKYEEP